MRAKNLKRISLCIKRLCDVIFSAAGLVFLSPLLIVLLCGIKLFIPGKALYLQTRVGYHQKHFTILKFKTMADEPEKEVQIPASCKWLRRFKLDELPQLYNILIGEMSFIGPRPYVISESQRLNKTRYQMRPGLTGLAQVYGNRELSWEERTAYDVEYIQNFSIALDLKILLRTIKTIALGEKACVKAPVVKL